MTDKQKVITASTLIPISAIGLIVAVAWWASGIDTQVRASTQTNNRQDQVLLDLAKSQERTAAILERLERKR